MNIGGLAEYLIEKPNHQVKGRRHAVPESAANDLNRLLDVLRCATFEAVRLRFELNLRAAGGAR